jgi:hypothetical protein
MAANNLVAFPSRNKGRVRKSTSLDAMGRCSLARLDRDREDIPPNVVDIREGQPAPELDSGSAALRLALAIFVTLGPDKKETIRDAMRFHARHTDGEAGDDARALLPILTRERSSC